jgi:hypothetical protein
MRLTSRLKKLDAALPKCQPGIHRLAVGGQVPSDADRCRWCGGTHVLHIEEVVVESREEAQMWRDKNGGRT